MILQVQYKLSISEASWQHCYVFLSADGERRSPGSRPARARANGPHQQCGNSIELYHHSEKKTSSTA